MVNEENYKDNKYEKEMENYQRTEGIVIIPTRFKPTTMEKIK